MNWVFYLQVLLWVVLTPHILLNKRDPRAAALWLLSIYFMPFLGAGLYYAVGMNRLNRKARRGMKQAALILHKPASPAVKKSYAGLEPLAKVADSLAYHPLVTGNEIIPLVNGEETYPAMLKAMAGAKKSLALCSFIFDQTPTGQQFLGSLLQAASRGVETRLLVDGMGAWGLGPQVRRAMAGMPHGRVATFWPGGRWFKHSSLNLRNHRKILVVDGKIGFTGGLNISGEHVSLKRHQQPGSRDIHFKLHGPVVAHLMEAFARDWEAVSGERLQGKGWFPALKPAGQVTARGFSAGPDQDFEKIYELVLGGLRAARKRVDLITPYFIPDLAMLSALRATGRSGVKVRLFIPRHSDHAVMKWAARGYLEDLVDSGVEVWEVGGGFVHSKLMVVDSHWVLLGSANLDPRSFRLNFEFNVEAYSRPLAARMIEHLDGHLQHSIRVDHAAIKREGVLSRLRNHTIKLFSPYL